MYKRRFKRYFDILCAAGLLVLFSWLFVLIGLLYCITFSFPLIFSQERIGKNETPFLLFKFRTLRDAGLPVDQRRFPLGDFLRRTSLDELPQLCNVLKGQMSFIGPRPLPVEYLLFFSAEQRTRHDVRPGITGLAQVNGRHSISWKSKFEYDVYYVQRISFSLDLKIFLKTLALLLSFRKDVSLDEEKFTGSA